MSLPGFGVRKPVPINLLMFSLLIGGAVCALMLRREFFPQVEPDTAQIQLTYPGATPSELEQTMAKKVEDAVVDLDNVDELRTTLVEGGGGITVQFDEDLPNIDDAVDDVKREIDRLTDLPEEAEKITVKTFTPTIPVIRLSVYGQVEEAILKDMIRTIRDELKRLPGMGKIRYSGVRDYELRVDVNQAALLEHHLSLPQVSDAISAWMAEVPGGMVRNRKNNVKVRTMGVDERVRAIEQIILVSDPQGRSLRVRDIAKVHRAFADVDLVTRFNAMPSVGLTVLQQGTQDIVHMASMVLAYVKGRRGQPLERTFLEYFYDSPREQAYRLGATSAITLPKGVRIRTSSNFSRFVVGRLNLLMRNALQGGLLVFATLLIFLNWRVAWWVFIGLLTALGGTLLLMFWTGITMNLLTMFGLIVVIGLLVDDGIVVSENIQKRFDRGEPALVAAQKGTEQVFWPVVATVLTSVVSFLPLRFIHGRMGDLMGALPGVVACALMMSLVEAMLVLPSHMGHSLKRHEVDHAGKFGRLLFRYEHWRDAWIFQRIVPVYGKIIHMAIRYRYLTAAATIAVSIFSVGMVVGGRIKYVFLPNTDSETLVVDVRMPIGTPITQTTRVADQIARAAQAQPQVIDVDTIVGERSNINTGAGTAFASNIAQIFIELSPVEKRSVDSFQVTQNIRDALKGKLPDVDHIRYSSISGGMEGDDITLEVHGQNIERMTQLADEIKRQLTQFEAVQDVGDDNQRGQREMQITLKPEAAGLGLTTANVARQVRGALYGLKAHVYTNHSEDIDIRVRLDPKTRQDLSAIQNLWIFNPRGKAIPLNEIANLHDGLAYASIHRVNRQRTITITANTVPHVSPNLIVKQFKEKNLPRLQQRYPDMQIIFGGKQKREKESLESLPYGMLAAFMMVYVILAWLFGSYSQPLAVMLAIPFSVVGVIWGHWVLGFDITFLSLIGFVALSGIVVNDSLILIEFYNVKRRQGHAMVESLVQAGCRRLRPIVLTTLTTVLGLLPLMLEQSFQAKFLIPMAIAISFGLLSATLLILLVLPCIIVIIDDFKAITYLCWHGTPRPAEKG